LITCVEPTAHVTAVFGAVTVMLPLPAAIVNFASEMSDPVASIASVAVTLIFVFVLAGPGAVHTQLATAPLTPVQPKTGKKACVVKSLPSASIEYTVVTLTVLRGGKEVELTAPVP
jgi:hypothetical protein